MSGFIWEHKELILVLAGALSLAYTAGKKVQELEGKDARIAAMHEVVTLQEKTIDEMVRAQEKISEAQRRR